jgi:hypothetical protein
MSLKFRELVYCWVSSVKKKGGAKNAALTQNVSEKNEIEI